MVNDMKTISLKAIEETLETLKYKFPIISVDDNYLTVQMDTGWLIINGEKFENYLRNEIKTFFRN
jgi:hypothetical protein